jgi:hypothetical protein
VIWTGEIDDIPLGWILADETDEANQSNIDVQASLFRNIPHRPFVTI